MGVRCSYHHLLHFQVSTKHHTGKNLLPKCYGEKCAWFDLMCTKFTYMWLPQDSYIKIHMPVLPLSDTLTNFLIKWDDCFDHFQRFCKCPQFEAVKLLLRAIYECDEVPQSLHSLPVSSHVEKSTPMNKVKKKKVYCIFAICIKQ